ncbi:nSTAND1 domain-containing NTPase [Streptomyces sp. 7R007]
MPRRERPLDAGDGPLREFAAGLRRLRRKAGNPPYRRLAERAHYSISTLSSAASGQRLPTLAVTLAYVRACDGDTGEWERRWRETARLLGAEETEPGPQDESGVPPPYVGLRPLTEQDAEWFFGREQLVGQVAGRLERQRFVMVIGASGSGKSSLLRAGLVPRLRAGGATVVVCAPGARPLEECAVRLSAAAGVTPGALYEELRADTENLSRVVRRITAGSDGPDGELVLVVDQFEETFTLCRDAAERDRFIRALVVAAAAPEGRCRVALGVRADFYGHCTRHAPLVEAMRDAQVPVGPMSLEELRQAVVGPAQRAGLSVEGALLATLTAQAYGRPGVLPLLSHALRETWRRRRGNALTLQGFEAAGGLEGGLAHTAEEFYQRLDTAQQELARRVFVRLTAPGEGTEDTRRPASLTELAGSADDDIDVSGVLEHAAAARLVVLDRERVELAHEALIRCWPRLQGWLAEDREATRTLRRLTEAAQTWETLGRDPGALYRGTRLALAAALDRASMSPAERAFLDASLAADSAERAAERRRVRLRRVMVALLSVLLVLATTTAVLAVRAQRSADRERDVASSQRAADKAAALRGVSPSLAAQLSLAAYRISPTPEARGALLSTFATPYATQLTGYGGAVTALAFRSDGKVLATGGGDGSVRLWGTGNPHRPRRLGVLALSGGVRALALSPDGGLLAAGGDDGAMALWDVHDPGAPTPEATLHSGAGPVLALSFGPDGRTLTAAARDGIRRWSLADARRPRDLGVREVSADVTAAAFSRDGRTLATGHADRTVRLWSAPPSGDRPGELSRAVGHRQAVTAVAFAPDGRRLATGSSDFTVRLWDTRSTRHIGRLDVLTAHTDTVEAVAFAPDGRTLATGSADATVRRWQVAGAGPARELAVLTGHTGAVGALAFGPDGRTLATGSEDETARLWDLPGPALIGHTSSVYSVAFSPDNHLLASGSYDQSVLVWNLADPRRSHEPVRLAGHTGPVNSVVFRAGSDVLASGSADGTVRLWEVDASGSGRVLTVLRPGDGHVNRVAFSRDGRALATGSESGTVRLWDTADPRRPRLLATLPAGDAVDCVAFSPDGRTLAVAGRDHTAALWGLADRNRPTRLAVLRGHSAAVKSVAFSPDGRTLATGSEDRTVRLWDVSDRRRPDLRRPITGYTDGVMAVAFAPDGRTLATASSDRTARLYALSGQGDVRELAVLTGHGKPVDTLAFSPDGRTLATGGEDWTVLLWDPDPERVAARICATVSPAMRRTEWRQYFPHRDYRPPCPEAPRDHPRPDVPS